MTESVRRRKSKWDIKGDTHHSPTENREDNDQSGKAGGSIHGKESQSEWDSLKSASNHGPKWSDMEATTDVQSKDSSGWSYVEPLPGNFEQKDENVDRDCDEISKTTWGQDQRYGTSMSPGLDGWREQNHRHSPNSSWSRSCRSRSRSPPHGFRHTSEGWNDRTRSGSGVSSPPCRDFAAGRCRRGSQCRFFHQDYHDYEGRKQSGSASSESRGSRHGRGGSVHADTEEQKDYSQDRMSHGYANHHDEIQKHDSQRNNQSAKKCFNFLRGKCNMGSSCKYSHDSSSPDGNVTGERAYNRRDMTSSHVNDHRHEPHRIKDILCKYFAAGNCHHGEYCKFSHESVSRGILEGRSQDDKWGHELVNELQSCEGSKWSHRAPDASHQGPVGMSQDDRLRFNLDGENRSWGDSKWNDKPADPDVCASTQWLSENNGASMIAPKSPGHEKLPNATHLPSAGVSREQYSHFTDKKEVGYDHQNPQTWTPNEITSTICEQNLSLEFSGRQQQHQTTVMVQPTASANAYIHQHPSLIGAAAAAAAIPYGYSNAVTNSAKPQNEINFSTNIPPTMVPGTEESFNQNGQGITPQTFSSLTMNGQSGQSSNLNGQLQQRISQPSSNPHHQTQCYQDEPIKKPDRADPKMSQMNSGTPMTQNVVTNEQASQITTISASLAQLFGNCQQLPQLYAVLNPSSSTEVVPCLPNSAGLVAPVAAPFIQPSQATWSQKQYDLNSNNIDSSKSDIIVLTSGTLVNPVEPASEESGAPSKSFAPSSGTCEPHGGNPFKVGGLEEKFHHESHEFKQLEPVAVSKAEDISERAADQIKEQQETGHVQDMDVDGHVEEDGKRSKDGKAMRMFKFTLVEFVKEILKPTWKEGQMSKEAHKTIVKKVVDKVTGTIQGAQIPQTQEKIDHYLSYCKPKLTKLVQGYVEKYLKN